MRTSVLLLSLFLPACHVAGAADWNEWRGPERNGIVGQSPALLDAWPAEGPKLLWKSDENVPGDKAGGFGSVVVAGGHVYCYFAPQRTEEIATRTLGDYNLAALGWSSKKMPADVRDKVEAARISAERQALQTPAEVQAWVKTWVETNLVANVKKQFADVVSDRLTRGNTAIDLAVLDKLEAIRKRDFASPAALDQWLDENNIQDALRKTIAARFPTSARVRDNVILCLDAATGKTVWKKVFPGADGEFGASCTPCVVNQRCYALGMGGKVFCLDARTGALLWEGIAGSGEPHSSFLVEDGAAIVTAGPLTAFDAARGQLLWTNAAFGRTYSSPVRWKKDGKTYVVARAGGKLGCLEPRTGKLLWSMPDTSDGHASGSSPAIDGDRMAVSAGTINLYKLSLEKAESYAQVTCPLDYSAGPTIVNGHAYVWGRKGASCISLETGKLAWTATNLTACAYSSSVYADGKMFIQGASSAGGYGDGSLAMFKVSADKGELLGKAAIRQTLCTTPAIADGRVYCRLGDGIACYDLRK